MPDGIIIIIIIVIIIETATRIATDLGDAKTINAAEKGKRPVAAAK